MRTTWRGRRKVVAVDVVRLLMVDDHRMLTEALSARLSAHSQFWVVGRCSTGDRQLPEMVQRLRPDLVTVDPRPAGPCASVLLSRLAGQRAGTRVVVLSDLRDRATAIEAARAGVAAWVPKDGAVDDIIRVLLGVSRGASWFPPDLLGPVLGALREDARRAAERDGPLDVLSDREREVLHGMVAGKRGSLIAEELRISAETVRTHVRSILSKLRVHNQVEAIRVAASAGVRPPEPR